MKLYLSAVALIFFCSAAFAQDKLVKISGTPDTSPVNLAALPHIEIKGKGHDGKEHVYRGVPVSDILLKAGVNLADKARRTALGTYVIFRAKDDYRVLFSLAEMDPLIASKTVVLADSIDGKPLDEHNGPYQVIVPGEKIFARWIRQVVSIEVGELK